MSERLQPILSLLDQGITLYRRNFLPFLLIAAAWTVPLAIVAGLLIASFYWLDQWQIIVFIFVAVLALLPALIYLVGGLSRAAVAAIEERPVRVREALSIHPLRIISMGFFSIVYLLIAQIVSSLLSLAVICPLYVAGFALVGGMASVGGSSAFGAVGLVLLGVLFTGVYGFALIIGGATYSGLVYGLQPWVQETRSFGGSLERSLNLIGYRFGYNLLIWGAAALLVAATGLTVTLTVGVVLPLPLFYFLGAESPATQAVSAVAWMIGSVFVLPPLPIWMALLYRRNVAARDAADLEARVQEWVMGNG